MARSNSFELGLVRVDDDRLEWDVGTRRYGISKIKKKRKQANHLGSFRSR